MHSMVDRDNSAHAATFSPMHFPLVLPLKYKAIFPKGKPISGTGSTVLLSSTDIVFNADQPLGSGVQCEISIDWPVLLEGRIGLQLVLRSKIARSEGQFVMGRVFKYEFRTAVAGASVDRRNSLVSCCSCRASAGNRPFSSGGRTSHFCGQ